MIFTSGEVPVTGSRGRSSGRQVVMERVPEIAVRVWVAGWWAGWSEQQQRRLLDLHVRPGPCPLTGRRCDCQAPDPDPSAHWN